jgi:bilirubin oxidase
MADPVSGGTLDPSTIAKYRTPLFVMPAMPRSGTHAGNDVYSIAVRQISQQVLPAGLPRTTGFAFGSTTDSGTFRFPGYTIEARVSRPTQVTWANELINSRGRYRPHLLPIDQTLHWANPAGGTAGRDSQPVFDATPGSYRGPVPLVVHLHGGHTHQDSDGHPEAWYLPAAAGIPSGYATVGSSYQEFKAQARSRFAAVWAPGTSILQYANDQRATALWYHTHEMGMTRVNMYAGLSGFYLLRGGTADLASGVLPGPAPKQGDQAGRRYYELPLVLQDKSFNTDGSLFFPAGRGFFGDVPESGPWIPDSDMPPIWNPEFFGSTILVNGNTWPVLNVEARRYRLRLLNASNARTFLLKIVSDPLAARPARAALPLWVIGADGGFLPAPASVDTMWLAVSERADVIVDFTGIAPGTELYLINEGPDEPFHGGTVGQDFEAADAGTTGQVMKFVVGKATSHDTSTPPGSLQLPARSPLGDASVTRRLSLNEEASTKFPDAPVMAALGGFDSKGQPQPMHWRDPVTEKPATGATEIWELHNFTADGHPIHLHLVQFEVINRQPFGGAPRPPQQWETGTKDVLLALPGETTRIKATFDRPGRFVWHCHIFDHEDNGMMRPLQVG